MSDSEEEGLIRVDNIPLQCPSFIYVVALSNNGKTYFIYEGLAKKALEEGFEIHYVVNSRFDIEVPIAEQAIANKGKVFIYPCKNIQAETFDKLMVEISKNDDKKLVVIDNFTYSTSLPMLDYITICRKFNSTSVFLSHTIFANQKISPRLRESVGTWILGYCPRADEYKMVLDSKDALRVFRKNIKAQSYKFMIYEPAYHKYAIAKLPEYKIELKVTDQRQKGKVAKALKVLEKELLEGSKTVASTQPDIRPQVVPKKRGRKKVVDLSEPPAKRICGNKSALFPPMENVYAIDPFAGQKKKWGI